MAKLITVYWRDIPAQVMLKQGRKVTKKELDKRFAEAIDRAAMRAGSGSSSAYLEDWRRDGRECKPEELIDLEKTVTSIVAQLESDFEPEYLEKIVKAGGLKPK